MRLDDIFGQDGLLARYLPGYRGRPQQFEMACAVDKALAAGRHILVEAGTGVGKSLAYLVPLINWVGQSDKRAVVSTYTKALQEQLIKKDLPFLRKTLGVDFSFALCLGGQNYLCLRRLRGGLAYNLFSDDKEAGQLDAVIRWQAKTDSGCRLDLDFKVSNGLWNNICRQSDLCLGRKCSEIKKCFYARARAKQYRSRILVVNHHLYFANLASDDKVLPSFDTVVFDEAHNLEEVAGNYLGLEISNIKVKYFLDSLFNPVSGKGFVLRLRRINAAAADDLEKHLLDLRLAADTLFSQIADKLEARSTALRIREKGIVFNHLKEPLSGLSFRLSIFLKNASSEEEQIEIISFIRRTKELSGGLEEIIGMNRGAAWAYWAEISSVGKQGRGVAPDDGLAREPTSGSRGRIRCSLCAAPIDIAEEFRQKVLDKVKPVIFTSATISTRGNLSFIRKRLGIIDADDIILGSPFDYSRNALLYTPMDLPDPKLDGENYERAVVDEIEKILRLMRGRTFVLFTSFRMLDAAYLRLKRDLGDLNILRQGQGPRYHLLERFRQRSSVLLATKTFWQGIDVPGRALECVIIARLPFAAPDDPLTEAKAEMLRSQGFDPFEHYFLPQAIILLKQGFGRLIRTQTDNGVVAILDPRINTRRYGQDFLIALPRCRKTSQLKDVKGFFSVFGPEQDLKQR